MKIIVIVCDSAGLFHCGFVKNPDLYRREIAAQSGGATVAFASAPILDRNGADLVATLQRRVLPRFSAGPHLQHDIRFLASVAWTVLGKPLLQAQAVRWLGAIRKLAVVVMPNRLLPPPLHSDAASVEHE
jgi:hypothetical protein